MAPSPPVRRAFACAAVRLLGLFAVVFYGLDLLTAARSLRVPLYFMAELRIPYWPWAFPVYFSVLAVPFLALWGARSALDVQRWERDMAGAIGIAGLCFLALPADLGYAQQSAGRWAAWATLAAWVAGRHNLLPSLHVALSLLTLLHFLPRFSPAKQRLLWAWFTLLVGSVLVTHQHHVADVIGGLLLALALAAWRARRQH